MPLAGCWAMQDACRWGGRGRAAGKQQQTVLAAAATATQLRAFAAAATARRAARCNGGHLHSMTTGPQAHGRWTDSPAHCISHCVSCGGYQVCPKSSLFPDNQARGAPVAPPKRHVAILEQVPIPRAGSLRRLFPLGRHQQVGHPLLPLFALASLRLLCDLCQSPCESLEGRQRPSHRKAELVPGMRLTRIALAGCFSTLAAASAAHHSLHYTTRMARAPSALLTLCAAVAALVLLPRPASAFVRVFGTKFADENCNEASARGSKEFAPPRAQPPAQAAAPRWRCFQSPCALLQRLTNLACHRSRSTSLGPTRKSSGMLGGDSGSCRKPGGHSTPVPPSTQPLLPSLPSPFNGSWRMLEAQAGLTGVQVS